MSYVKLGQIADIDGDKVGLVYLEDENGQIAVNIRPMFPLKVTVEVITWVSFDEQKVHGEILDFKVEEIIVPDSSIEIRRSVYNQLVSKYSTLVI